MLRMNALKKLKERDQNIQLRERNVILSFWNEEMKCSKISSALQLPADAFSGEVSISSQFVCVHDMVEASHQPLHLHLCFNVTSSVTIQTQTPSF